MNTTNKGVVYLDTVLLLLPFQTAADGDRMKPLNPIQISEQKRHTPADVTSPTPAKIAKLDISAGAGTSKDVPENSKPMTGNTMNSTSPNVDEDTTQTADEETRQPNDDVIATAAKINVVSGKILAQVRYILLCLIN